LRLLGRASRGILRSLRNLAGLVDSLLVSVAYALSYLS